MSLFPAYQLSADTKVDPEGSNHPDKTNANWTRNESFNIEQVTLKQEFEKQLKKSSSHDIPISKILLLDESKLSPSRYDSKSCSESEEHNDDKNYTSSSYCKEKEKRTRTQKRSRSHSRSRSRSKSRSKHRSKRSRSRSPSYSPRRSNKKKKKHKLKKHKKRSRDKYESQKQKLPQFIPYKTFLEEFNIKDEDELRYAEDRYGDHQFSSLTSLPERKTAKYHRRWKVDYQILGSNCKSNPNNRHESGKKKLRFYSKDYVKIVSNASTEKNHKLASYIDNNKNPDQNLMHQSYITLEDTTQAKSADVNDITNNDCDIDEEYSSTDKIELSEIYTKTKEFNSLLRNNPNDVQLWLDYVSFQDVALCDTNFTSTPENEENKDVPVSKKTVKARNVLLQKKAVVEKKLSILKAASDKNPDSILLAVERLKLSKELYDNSTLDRQWKELIFLYPGNLEVWKHYLSFNTSHFTTFSVNKLAKSFKNYFLKLKQMHGQGSAFFHESSNKSSCRINTAQIEDEMVKLILRIANHWTRAGYKEKSIGLFQALVELNLYSPNFPGSYSLEDRLATFEPFWESGFPRIGEDNALGWETIARSKHMANINDTEVYNPNNDDIEDNLIQSYIRQQTTKQNNIECKESDSDENYDNKSGEPRLWLKLELERERRHWRPWRSQEEEAEDPDRSVCFEDIQDFLFQFPLPSVSTNSRPFFNLILGFLRHLGVDISESGFDMFGILSTQAHEMKYESKSPEQISVDEQLLCGNIMQSVTTNITDISLQRFIRNIFRGLSKTMNGTYKTQIVILWMRFEKSLANTSLETNFETNSLTSDKKAKAKLIKNEVKIILDQDRENVDIYCSYANFIFTLEGFKNSWKIFKMLLQSRCQNRGVTQNKNSIKIYIHSIVNELNELTRLKRFSWKGNEKPSEDETRALHLHNIQWLLCLATEKNAYKDCHIQSKHEMNDLVERSGQKNSHWIHKQLAGNVEDIIRGTLNGNDQAEITPVSYYNEFVAKVFIQVWLLYFETNNTEEPVKFVKFVQNKLNQKIALQQSDTLHYVIELIHKISIDFLLYDQSLKSIQLGKTVLVEALNDYPCNFYLLRTGLLSNNFNIQTNVTSSVWKALYTSLVRRKVPCKSFVISILARFLLNKFLNIEPEKISKHPFNFKNLIEKEDISVGHLNQAQTVLDHFIQNNANEQIASPIVWRLLLWVTRAKHELNPAKYPLANVKTMFYRACQDNPGAKVYFLDTMNYCESATKTDIIDMKGKYIRKKFRSTSKAVRETQTELQNLMTEKDIHVRIPMEELQVMLDPEDGD